MDYGAQAEDKAERYEVAFHGRVSGSPARAGVPSVFFFNRVIDDVLDRQADVGLLLREVGHGVNKGFEALPVLGDNYIG